MNCTTPITHTIVAGDTLWSLAIRYNTTVEKLLELNPGVEVYNLQIGSELVVCEPSPVLPPIEPPTPPTVCPRYFRDFVAMQMCWVAEQFGADEARRIIRSICTEWAENGNPCN